MTRTLKAAVCLCLFVVPLAGCGVSVQSTKPTLGRYPFNFKGQLAATVSAPDSIRSGSVVQLKVVVKNASTSNLETNDAEVSLLEAPDVVSPLNWVKVKGYTPPITPGGMPASWKIGALQSEQTKSWQVAVVVPAHIINSASRLCFEGDVGFSAREPPYEGWSEPGQYACAVIRR